VSVSSGPWMQELSFLKQIMKEKLNQRLGGEIVREIVLKSGRVVNPAEPLDDQPLHKIQLSARQLALINEQAASIADPETRQAFAGLMKASLESETCSPPAENPLSKEQQ